MTAEPAMPSSHPFAGNVVILAAGKGKRMASRLPKVLQPLAGKPLLQHVVETARALYPQRLAIVYGHGGDTVRAAITGKDIHWIRQAEQLGTGHAVHEALTALDLALPTLVLYGDVPLIQGKTLARLIAEANHPPAGLGLLTVTLENPHGYGRIKRDQNGNILAIVEEKDAADDERSLRETNTGIMVIPAGVARTWLAQLDNANAQGEYYLTDLVARAVMENVPVRAIQPVSAWEAEGANDRAQLAALERHYQRQQAEQLMASGVHLLDPARLDVRGALVCGQDVTIDVGCIFTGNVQLGSGVTVGPYCVLNNVTVAAGTVIAAFSHIDGAEIGEAAVVGPYARLRPGATIGAGGRVGNFVEIKNTHLGEGSKVNHLAYLGDAEVGCGVNIGAGVITCNYDGVHKHKTVIGDHAFIGSDCQLVAPVEVGASATIGAGTTVRQNAPAGALTLMQECAQKTIPAWEPRQETTNLAKG